MKIYPERFFDILYQKNEMFTNPNLICEFLPGLNFKDLWICDISDKTRETIWKYLQLVLFTVTININNQDTFGDTANLFSAINEDELKTKLEETVSQMHDMFDLSGMNMKDMDMSGINLEDLPNPTELHDHINGMLDGKLGKLAREIAEETASEINMNMEDATSVNDVFEQLFKNPGKLMGLVNTVGAKLDTKIKSGEIKESELMAEAGDMMNKMKNMPGMDNIQEMLNKMAGKGKKFDMNKFNSKMKTNTQKERMLNKLNAKKEQQKQQQQKEAELGHMDEMKKMQFQLEQMQNQLQEHNIDTTNIQKYNQGADAASLSDANNTNKVDDIASANSDKGNKKKRRKNKAKKNN
jgi:hypothetical protein